LRRLVALVIATQLLVAVPASATDVASLADQAALRHYATEEGVPVDVNAMEAFVAELPAGTAFYFVALAEDPSGGADVVANDILTALQTGTVIVVSPTDLGAASSDYTNVQLSGALDASLTLFDTSYVEGFRAFADTLMDAAPAEGPSGSGGTVILLLLLGAVVLVVVIALRRGKKNDEEIQQGRLTEARSEIRTQLDAVANRIVELNDQIDVADNEEATGHYREAAATFDDIRDSFEQANSLSDMESIARRLDHARWQLEAADAITEGRPIPEEPTERSTACFFDPTHRGGTEEATITTPAGSQTVSVCHDCAERLRKGEQPTPRQVSVDGRKVPVAMAPRSHGGAGVDVAGIFQMLVAGMGAAAQYRTSRRRVTPTARTRRASASRTRASRAVRSSVPKGRARRRRS
jgi:hypothetical protein